MPISRRQFLQASTVLGLGSLASYTLPARAGAAENLILGGGRFRQQESEPYRHVLSVVDIDKQSNHLIDTHFFPHGIHQHVFEPHRLALFEKKGPGACEVDLTTGQVTRKIHTDPSRYFYGHGAYSINGEQLLCTESYLDSKRGIIAIRDSKTMDSLGEFPTYGSEPHECKLIDKGKTLVVTNAGSRAENDAPSVTYIDMASQQLLEKVPLSNPKIGSGHLGIGEDGSLVVVSPSRTEPTADQLGGVSIRPRGETMESIEYPTELVSQLKGEALSVAIYQEGDIAGVTHPSADKVTFWSTTNRKHVATLELPQPRGIALTRNNDFFIISYDAVKPKIVRVPVTSLNTKSAIVIDNTFISGSHIYNWSRGLTELGYPGPLV